MRQIRVGETLDGQTLIGPARESYFQSCSMVGTVLQGDWRGSDFLGCNLTGANLFAAQTYACYWRGCVLADCLFPANIGWLHHEPVAEVIRQRVIAILPSVPTAWRPKAKEAAQAVVNFVKADYLGGSWVPSYEKVKNLGLSPARTVTLFRAIFQPYPVLAQRFEELIMATIEGTLKSISPGRTTGTLTWLDGVSVTVDAYNLPVLSVYNRYELARWIEAQAGVGHYAFVLSVIPMSLWMLGNPDDWFILPRGGY